MEEKMNEKQSGGHAAGEQEIDLVELIGKLWKNRGLIIKITLGFMVFGLLVALFSAKSFTAGCEAVPQAGGKRAGGSLGALASLAGINMNNMGGDAAVLSPLVYSNIVSSVPFRKELMNTKIDFDGYDRPITLLDYYTNPEYRKTSVLGTVKKYTIGLPFVLLNAIRGKQEEPEMLLSGGGTDGLAYFTEEEQTCAMILSQAVAVSLDEKNGYVSITASMPEPLAAAQVAQATLTLLQKYVFEFTSAALQENLAFIQKVYDESKSKFEQAQRARAVFLDANRNLGTYSAQMRLEQLNNDYQLAMTLYTEFAQQLEQAKIKVQEKSNVLTVINPVTIPREKSKPKRGMILVAFTFLGGIFGVGAVLTLPLLADITGKERFRKLVKE